LIGSTWRIPVGGLTQGNQRDDTQDIASWDNASKRAKDYTDESAIGRAVVLAPDALKAKASAQQAAKDKQIADVMVFMHGNGIGYRQRSTSNGKKGMEKGTVRDVEVDRMSEQLEAAARKNGRPIVGMLAQGAYRSQFKPKYDLNFGNNFNGDDYIKDVWSKTNALKDATQGRVILAGHSGAGNTLAPMLNNAVNDKGELKSEAEMKKAGIPTNLAEVVLFDSINGDGQRWQVERWLKAQISKDMKALAGATDQEAYLKEHMMRFRGYYSQDSGYYGKSYKDLKKNIAAEITRQVALAKKEKRPIDPKIEKLLRENYVEGIQEVDTGEKEDHEYLMGSGKLEEALGALPQLPVAGTSNQQPATSNIPAVQRMSVSTYAASVQRTPVLGTPTVGQLQDMAPKPPTNDEIAQSLIAETVELAGTGGTLLRPEQVQTALDGRAGDADLSRAFDKEVQTISATTSRDPLTLRFASRWQAKSLLRAVEKQFIHNPDASTLDLLSPERARRYRDFAWHRLDYPGQSRTNGELDPAGPNEARATEMANDLSAIRPERRVNTGDDAVVTQGEFDANMRRHVTANIEAVPGQGGHRLHREARDSFVRMQTAAEVEGVNLVIEDSYRSPQAAGANASRSGNPNAVANFSAHSLGLAVDFRMSHGRQNYSETTTRPMQNVVDMRESPVHKWLFLRGADYGWHPYQNEPWHWEYNPSGFREQFRATPDTHTHEHAR
jgi:LAS superfamily LD-carboxypeptidase LdcB